jgi:hypothetical protein
MIMKSKANLRIQLRSEKGLGFNVNQNGSGPSGGPILMPTFKTEAAI